MGFAGANPFQTPVHAHIGGFGNECAKSILFERYFAKESGSRALAKTNRRH